MQRYKIYIDSNLTGKVFICARPTRKGALNIATKKYNHHQKRIDISVTDSKGKTIYFAEAKYK